MMCTGCPNAKNQQYLDVAQEPCSRMVMEVIRLA